MSVSSAQVGSAVRQLRRADRHDTRERVTVRVPRTVVILAVIGVLAAGSVIPHSGGGPRLSVAEAAEVGVAAAVTPKGRQITPNGPWPGWMMTAEPSQLTPAGVAALALAVGCQPVDAITATAVGLAESSGRTDAVGDEHLVDRTWSWSAGVWQIRGLRAEEGLGTVRDSQHNLHDGWANAWAMVTISDGCTSWRPWTTYKTGAYRDHLPEATAAVLYVLGVL